MKNHLKTRGQIALLSVLMLGVSCTGLVETKEVERPEVTTTQKIHVAFAGGGWRAHTGHTAWLASSIRPGQSSLGDFFKGAGTISSNSGGSWFSTMAVYDSNFNTAMNKGAPEAWLATQKLEFAVQDPSVCVPFTTITECVLSESYSLNWRSFVEGIVYKGSSIDTSMTLSSKPMAWAKDTPLLLAGALLTHDAVIDGTHAGDKSYYWACPSGSTPYLETNSILNSPDGDKGGKCRPTALKPDVIPVTFSNDVARTLAKTTPDFLKGKSPAYKIGYSQNSLFGSPLTTTTIANPLISDQVVVLDAASASSAAAGYAASSDVSGSWTEAFVAENMAIDFQVKGGVVKQVDPPFSYSNLSTNQVIKIADGGAVDNTGVAQLVSFLQKTGQDKNFFIVSFDSYLVAYKEDFFGNWTTIKYGKDGLSDGMRYLIGDLKTPDPYSFEGYDVNLPDLRIFDVTNRQVSSGKSFANPSCPQNGSGDGANGRVFLSMLSVTTRKNEAFDVAAGSSGMIFVFSSENSALTAPEKLSSFDCYNEMLTNMTKAISGDAALTRQLEAVKNVNLSR